MLTYILVIVIFLFFLEILLNHNAKARIMKKIPGPKNHFLVGNALVLMVSSVQLMKDGREFARKWKEGIYRFWMFAFAAINIFHPNYVEIITSDVKHNEKSALYSLLKPWLADGLLLSKGTKWMTRRKILTPAFHFNILRQFFGVMKENSCELVEKLNDTDGQVVDIVPFVSDLTLQTICETAMGTKLDDKSSHGINLDDSAEDETLGFKRKRQIAMLDLLILAAQEGLIDRQGIQEEVDTFMFKGHDTTAAGLIYCLMLLANHKDVQDKIFNELNEIFEDRQRPINIQDLNKMKYLECCIKESIRLYPPIHFISRSLNEPVTLDNYEVPAGIFCHIHIYDLHRREDLFPNPNDFIPERFYVENSLGRHPFAYIPFSAGPRNCIGQKFALMEMKCVVATILRSFELIPKTRPCDIEYVADLVLRNNGPVEVKFVKRAQN